MRIKVVVTAGARRERFVETAPGVFEVKVREEAEANMANARVRELVALHYGVDVKKVRIETGHTSPRKTLLVIL